MQTKIPGSFFAFIFGLMLLSSCASHTLVPEPSSVNPDQPVSFSTQIQPIFTQSCAMTGCHAGSVAPDLSAGKAYADIMSMNLVDTLNDNKSVLYVEMAPGGSMSNFCTKDQSDLVLVWIQQGAKNN
jgi:hypothetical protein